MLKGLFLSLYSTILSPLVFYSLRFVIERTSCFQHFPKTRNLLGKHDNERNNNKNKRKEKKTGDLKWELPRSRNTSFFLASPFGRKEMLKKYNRIEILFAFSRVRGVLRSFLSLSSMSPLLVPIFPNAVNMPGQRVYVREKRRCMPRVLSFPPLLFRFFNGMFQ